VIAGYPTDYPPGFSAACLVTVGVNCRQPMICLKLGPGADICASVFVLNWTWPRAGSAGISWRSIRPCQFMAHLLSFRRIGNLVDDGEMQGNYAFLCSSPEDGLAVDRLQAALGVAGVRVWRDTERLLPGEDRRERIRQAITSALAFVACLSRAGLARERSDLHEQLGLAAEELGRRRSDIPWLVPVRLDDCMIPDLALGGGRTFGQLVCADLFGERQEEEMARLVSAIAELCGRPGGQDPVVPGTAAPQVWGSLPSGTAVFIGRDKEMAAITAAVNGAAAASGVVAVHAIGGMPGVGKTALAVHAAHAVAAQFPGRRLFLDLRAHAPGCEPVTAVDALEGLLAAVGVDSRRMPGDLSGRAALWRERMAGQRAVLVLDNAASSDQVEPLLPGPGCLVLVTSRRHLGDLPGEVTSVPLDTLPSEDAVVMFTRLASCSASDADRVAEVVELAGFLPLAISLLARVLARHPCWSLEDLAGEVRAGLLDLIAEHRSVAAAFDLSYQHLDPRQQRFFRLLGLHPGTVDKYAAAALVGVSAAGAAKQLDALHGEALLTEIACRRYSLHDLIRRYACDVAAVVGDDSGQALGRLQDYYLHTAALASEYVARQSRPGLRQPVPPGTEVPVFEDAGQALAWMRAERAGLLACLDLAAKDGQQDRVVALTAGLAVLLWRDGGWADAVTRHDTAIMAARHLGDRLGEANALTDRGIVQRLAGDYLQAGQALEEALRIYRELGDRLGEANAGRELGVMRGMTGQDPDAVRMLEDALGIYSELGDRLGEGNALRDLGSVRWLTGQYPGAIEVLDEALSIWRDTGNRHAEANVLTDLGGLRQLTGDLAGAVQALQDALEIYRDIGNQHGRANALTQLGAVQRAKGDCTDAAQALQEAMEIYSVTGNQHGQANATTELGVVQRATGQYPDAAQTLGQALNSWRALGIRYGEIHVLNELGTLHRLCGDLTRAKEHHGLALYLAGEINSACGEAHALAGLGRCAIAAGDTTQARILLQQALPVFERTGAAEARSVQADLNGL
jgi:tetratricopeptide (TPR) repeat protein